jgi:hypothetical protein
MPNLVRIDDLINGAPAFDLKDVLCLLPPAAHMLTWRILDMSDGRGDAEKFAKLETCWPEINRKAQETADGMLVDWDTLVAYADAMLQIVDGLFVGCSKSDCLADLTEGYSDGDLYARVDIAIEAVDSSFWLVYARDETFLAGIETRFHDVVPQTLP